MIELSIVVPCFNEEKNLKKGLIEKVLLYLNKQTYGFELIMVDDGSTDQSLKLLKKILDRQNNCYLVRNPHQGKAAAIISGVMKSKGEFVLFSDLDQATPIDQIEKFFPYLESGFDVVVGSRNSKRQGAPFIRAIMGPTFMILRQIILGMGNISDTQCGFKAFKTQKIKKIFQELRVYGKNKKAEGPMVTAGFDVELLYVATKKGLKIKEVPVDWFYKETRRVNPFHDSFSALSDLISIRLNDLMGKYA